MSSDTPNLPESPVALDFSEYESPARVRHQPSITTRPTDLPYLREEKRGQIALILVCLLVGVVVLSFALAALRNAENLSIGGLSVPEVKEILTIIFSPIVALVGTVTGFYYGGKPESRPEELATSSRPGASHIDKSTG